MIKPIHSPHESINFHARPLPKTVTIVSKNGKDVIKDEFVGYHYQRTPFFEFIRDMFASLSDMFARFQK